MTGKFDPKAIFSTPIVAKSGELDSRLKRVVGVDDLISNLTEDLNFIFQPNLASKWSDSIYKKQIPLVQILEDFIPLIIFEGDVGTGKTEVAETIGSSVAFKHKYEVQTLKMSTQVRGSGFVGEMTTLLSQAFDHVKSMAQKAGVPTLLIIDEADSLLTSRAASGQHHEDKAGVNTIIQHLDSMKKSKLPIAVIAISNRSGALDPALKRRSTAVFTFERPTEIQRKELFKRFLDGMDFNDKDFSILAKASSEKKIAGKGELSQFSYADLTLRFLLPELRHAVGANRKITIESLTNRLNNLEPSPSLFE